MKRICIFNKKKGQKPNQKEKESALHSITFAGFAGLARTNQHPEKTDADNNAKNGPPNGQTSGQGVRELSSNAGYSGSVINCHFNHLKVICKVLNIRKKAG